jgi:hypothetical protein
MLLPQHSIRYLANLSEIASSVHVPSLAPVPPLTRARFWIPSNCRFRRWSSLGETARGGRWIRNLSPDDFDFDFEVEIELVVKRGKAGDGDGFIARWVWSAVRREDVVLVKICNASGGGFVACNI